MLYYYFFLLTFTVRGRFIIRDRPEIRKIYSLCRTCKAKLSLVFYFETASRHDVAGPDREIFIVNFQ